MSDKPPFYHGSLHRFARGEMVEPGYPTTEAGHPDADPDDLPEPDNYVYFTQVKGVARMYHPDNVAIVEPTGEYEKDADDVLGFRSKHPLRVVDEA